ncbi:MAG: DoxX family protein [Bacteroidia bacterium]|nr:DoxX family protein [Bacteroidia bacterium]
MRFLQNTALLFVRLLLAYGFYEPAKMKWQNLSDVVMWFKDLNIPFPFFSACLTASFETIGILFLIIGLFVRYISVVLMIIMIVAIMTVHWNNGFDASNNGVEIPLYYLILLYVLVSFGSGKWGMDSWLYAHTKWGKQSAIK